MWSHGKLRVYVDGKVWSSLILFFFLYRCCFRHRCVRVYQQKKSWDVHPTLTSSRALIINCKSHSLTTRFSLSLSLSLSLCLCLDMSLSLSHSLSLSLSLSLFLSLNVFFLLPFFLMNFFCLLTVLVCPFHLSSFFYAFLRFVFFLNVFRGQHAPNSVAHVRNFYYNYVVVIVVVVVVVVVVVYCCYHCCCCRCVQQHWKALTIRNIWK